jgi:DNA mismatch repair protein MutS
VSRRHDAIDLLLTEDRIDTTCATSSAASATSSASCPRRPAQRPPPRPGGAARQPRTTAGCTPASKTPTQEALHELLDEIATHPDDPAAADAAIVDNPPVVMRDGGVIATGYDDELDSCATCRRTPTSSWSTWSSASANAPVSTPQGQLQPGARLLHRDQPYQSDQAPDDYIRRQTLKGAERFITPELKAFEDKVLSARERALQREKALYEDCSTALPSRSTRCVAAPMPIARLDVLELLSPSARDSSTCVDPCFATHPG